MGLVRPAQAGAGRLEVLACRKFRCRDFATLADLLLDFMRTQAGQPVAACVIACSGKVVDDAVINETLAWQVRVTALRARLPFAAVALLNDFEALGYAFEDLRAADALRLCGPDDHPEGPALVVGPGTGLGSAVRLSGDADAVVLASEAGQMDFAPGTPREREVLARLAEDFDGYVAYEHVLSGPGLLNVYTALSRVDGLAPALGTPAAITAAAAAGTDRTAVETVALFCAVLGGFAGNLAMAYMARGGVYLAGGVLPHVREPLRQGAFAARFVDKGGMRRFLERVPVRLIEHGQHGLLGAARWYLDQHAQGWRGCGSGRVHAVA